MRTARDRFDEKWTEVDSGCWEWQACRDSDGYGRFNYGGKGVTHPAHRIAWLLYRGEIPEGLQIDHLCRNHSCVNPSHLEPVTQRVNLLRGETVPAARAAQTQCASGHPFDEKNTYRDKQGRRYCRKCRARAARDLRKKANKDE